MQFLFWREGCGTPPLDKSRSARNIDQQRRLLARWKFLFPRSRRYEEADLDFEDFWEPASLLLAAIEAGYPCWEMEAESRELIPLSGQDPRDAPVGGDGPPTILIGRLPGRDLALTIAGFASRNAIPLSDQHPLSERSLALTIEGLWGGIGLPVWPSIPDIRKAEGYPASQTFRRFAGRWTRIAGIPSDEHRPGSQTSSQTPRFDRKIMGDTSMADPPMSVAEAVLEAHQQGLRRVFLKVNKAKYLTCPLDLPDTLTREKAQALVAHVLGYASTHLEGYADAVLVQEWVPMRREYRFLVCDSVPVTGAGIVPEYTPLDADPATAFSPIVRKVAHQVAQERLTDQELAGYVDLASRYALEVRAENGLRDFVLDVCTIEGRPAVVEVNPCQNMGLYASRTDLWIQAVATACAARLANPEEGSRDQAGDLAREDRTSPA